MKKWKITVETESAEFGYVIEATNAVSALEVYFLSFFTGVRKEIRNIECEIKPSNNNTQPQNK